MLPTAWLLNYLPIIILYFYFSNPQKSQKIFRANGQMDLAAARTKVLGFGMQLLDGIDPNPDNFVCAGIIHTRTQQIGCLLRLEPNKQAQVGFNSKVIYLFIIQTFMLRVVFSKNTRLVLHFTYFAICTINSVNTIQAAHLSCCSS